MTFGAIALGVVTSQLQLYVGIDGNNFLRAGFHDDNRTDTSLFIYGIVNGSQTPYWVDTGPLGIHPGDDASLSLTRHDGLWSVVWQSLTNPSVFGTSNFVAVPSPDLSSAPTLYTGIYYNTPIPHSPQTETSGITSFSVTPAPEPSSIVIFGIGCLAMAFIVRRKPRD
jgi:PEP-CTERM motif